MRVLLLYFALCCFNNVLGDIDVFTIVCMPQSVSKIFYFLFSLHSDVKADFYSQKTVGEPVYKRTNGEHFLFVGY